MMTPPITPASPSTAARTRWLMPLAAGLLVAAALLAYRNSLQVPFLFDDRASILENPTIAQLWPPWKALSPPRNGSGVTGRPLVNLSLAFNHALGGTGVSGYHAFNLVLHVLSALLLFGLTYRALRQRVVPDRFRSAALLLSFFIALLWTVHPLQTETVTCVVQRTEGLVALFYLLTLYTFIRGVDYPRQKRWWFAATIGACFAGMASKEVMVSAPLMVLLFDRTFLGGSFGAAWQRRRPLYLGLASSWLLLAVLTAGTSGRAGTVGFGLGVSSWDYLLTQCHALVLYLKLSLWPAPLVVDYGSALVRRLADVWVQGVAVLAILAGTVFCLWRRPLLGFAGAWFFLILAPSSSLVPLASQTIAEHRMYLPLASLLALFVLGLHSVMGRSSLAVLSTTTLGLGWLTVQRNNVYRSELSLWTDTVAHVPGNVRAHTNLGNTLYHLGRVQEAVSHFESALRLDPNSVPTHINLASAYAHLGRPADAVVHGEAAVGLAPKDPDGHVNLGNALIQLGRTAEAVAHYEAALRLQPGGADIHVNLGAALTKIGRHAEAISHYEQALRLQPADPAVAFALGNLLARAERFDEAVAAFRRTVQLDPIHVAGFANLGNALFATGRVAEAIAAYEAALRLQPRDERLRENLALARAAAPPR